MLISTFRWDMFVCSYNVFWIRFGCFFPLQSVLPACRLSIGIIMIIRMYGNVSDISLYHLLANIKLPLQSIFSWRLLLWTEKRENAITETISIETKNAKKGCTCDSVDRNDSPVRTNKASKNTRNQQRCRRTTNG